MSNETSSVGEDIVVYIGIFQGRVSVLPETVEEEDDAESGGGAEDGEGRGEEF